MLDVHHERTWWTLAHQFQQPIERLGGARRGEFHGAIVEVAHPAGEIERARPFPHEPSEADALNPPRDLEVNGGHSLL